MVKKNSNFKFKGSAKRSEKKQRKIKSGFMPYDADSALFKNDDSADELVRTYLRDSRDFRGGGYSGGGYEDDYSSMW